MAKNYYLPSDDSGKADLLDQFAAKLPKYSAALEISASDLASAQADVAAFRYAIKAQQQMQTNAQQWTAYKNLLRDGGPAGAAMPAVPALPTPAPAAVAPGIIDRFTALVVRLKNHKNYTDAIGQDLGVVGAEQVVEPNSWKPMLRSQIQAGRPTVQWTKGDASALELWVDRGDGFTFLAIDTHPPYQDTAPLPALGASAVWKYKAIYRLHDEQVGQWSDVLSVTVGG